MVTPFVGLGLADGGGRLLRLGALWSIGPSTSLNLEAVRIAAANDDTPEQRLGVAFSTRW